MENGLEFVTLEKMEEVTHTIQDKMLDILHEAKSIHFFGVLVSPTQEDPKKVTRIILDSTKNNRTILDQCLRGLLIGFLQNGYKPSDITMALLEVVGK